MKKSLIVTEKEKYPDMKPSPVVAEGENAAEKKPDRKFAPTITLRGKQIDAFCACSLKSGDKGTATVHWLVKSIDNGTSSYGDELVKPSKKPKEVVLQITHVEADEADEKEEPGEDAAEEKDETPEVEAGEEDTEDTAEGEATTASDRVSPSDAKLED